MLCRSSSNTLRWSSDRLLSALHLLPPQRFPNSLDVIVEASSKLFTPAPGLFDDWVLPHCPIPRRLTTATCSDNWPCWIRGNWSSSHIAWSILCRLASGITTVLSGQRDAGPLQQIVCYVEESTKNITPSMRGRAIRAADCRSVSVDLLAHQYLSKSIHIQLVYCKHHP